MWDALPPMATAALVPQGEATPKEASVAHPLIHNDFVLAAHDALGLALCFAYTIAINLDVLPAAGTPAYTLALLANDRKAFATILCACPVPATAWHRQYLTLLKTN
mmetsp:Transcript_13534/g.26665  ORF Transcript_13534/g.26665 Transcript_13534/m.26665 type:complete len:106 (-) Transcript_13534:187-504(-)